MKIKFFDCVSNWKYFFFQLDLQYDKGVMTFYFDLENQGQIILSGYLKG